MSEHIQAQEARVGDLIYMQTNQYWWRWGYVTRVGRSSSGGTIYFDGETDQGVQLRLVKRATSVVERRGHRRARSTA